jgi:hypothetical protein
MSLVDKRFYGLSRHNACWESHKHMLIEACPPLQEVFELYKVQQPKSRKGNKRIKLTKRTQKKGTWYVIVNIFLRLKGMKPNQIMKKYGDAAAKPLLDAILRLNIPLSKKSIKYTQMDYKPKNNLYEPMPMFIHVAELTHIYSGLKRQYCYIMGLKKRRQPYFKTIHPFDTDDWRVKYECWLDPFWKMLGHMFVANDWSEYNEIQLSHCGLFGACRGYDEFFSNVMAFQTD